MPIKQPKKVTVEQLPPTDELAKEEAKNYENNADLPSLTASDIQNHLIEKLKQEIIRYIDDSFMRKVLVGIFTAIIIAWLTFVAGMTISCSRGEPKLSDQVLITLLTTTTITVIGMMHIILKNLFPSSETKERAIKKKNK